MKKIILLSAIILSFLILCACGKKNNIQITENTTIIYKEAPTETEKNYFYNETSTTDFSLAEPVGNVPEIPDISINSQTPQITQAPQESAQNQIPQTTATETAALTTEKVLEKTGEMEFSDDANNKYIKAVTDKYGINAKNLAVIYTVPDNNGNLVFEFDGSKDEKGKLIRNESTLIALYSVDKNLNCKRASENSELNEYSYGEMKVMFITTTKYFLPKFEKELNG